MRRPYLSMTIVLFLCCLTPTQVVAQERLKPYLAGKVVEQDAAAEKARLAAALKDVGFEVVGEYSPRDGAHVLAFTSDAIKANAAASEFGGYTAVLRAAVVTTESGLKLSWTNPAYWALLYRTQDPLSDVAAQLEKALGPGAPFGSRKGIPPDKLRKYRYMISMPRFEDHHLLKQYESQEAAIEAVEKGLTAGAGGTRKVYRVDVPGKAETLFGVAVLEGDGADKVVLETCDIDEQKHVAYAPWEILVSQGKVYAHHGRFRIAASFPDLGMGTFMKIVKAPGAIRDALAAAAGE